LHRKPERLFVGIRYVAEQSELEKENAKLREQIAGLEKAMAEAKTTQASARPSKSREQAEAVRAILDKDGKITKEQLDLHHYRTRPNSARR
jgi:peptidoglycan hydrolase CwlO-like protein